MSMAHAYATVTAGLHAEFPVDANIPNEIAVMLERLEHKCKQDAAIGTVYPVSDLKISKGYWYLATPYSKWAGGHEDAMRHAAVLAGRLRMHEVFTMSPIAHSHPIWTNSPSLKHTSHGFWMDWDWRFVDQAHGILVADMHGWRESAGVGIEIEWARKHKKPLFLVNPTDLSFRAL